MTFTEHYINLFVYTNEHWRITMLLFVSNTVKHVWDHVDVIVSYFDGIQYTDFL